MGDEPAVTLGNAADEAMRLYGDAGDGNDPVAPEPVAPEAPEAEPEAAPEAEPEAAPEATPEPTQATPTVREYDIDGRKVSLSDSQVNYLLRLAAQKLQADQAAVDRGPPEPEPQPEPQTDTSQFTAEELKHPLVQRLLASEAKLKRLESVDARLSDYEQRQQAKEIVDTTLSTMKKVDFFKDATPDEQHEYLGEILMLQNVNKKRGMTTEEAVRSIADRYERKINARTEKWKQGKIAAAGQKVEGGGATHATKPPKRGINDLFNGKAFEHAMNFARGVKAD